LLIETLNLFHRKQKLEKNKDNDYLSMVMGSKYQVLVMMFCHRKL
jgi:hypothetical protein